jgi:hypothetical protein
MLRDITFTSSKQITSIQKTKAMKTTKFYTVLSLVMIFTGMTSLFSTAKANQGGYPIPSFDDKKFVTYVVDIAHDAGFDQELVGYMVIMTDGKGRTIAPPQQFVPGTWTYIFTEAVPATGSRTATFIKAPHTYGTNIHFRSTTIHGPFEGGRKYTLTVYPDSNADGPVGIK